jgi:hypothetical protein
MSNASIKPIMNIKPIAKIGIWAFIIFGNIERNLCWDKLGKQRSKNLSSALKRRNFGFYWQSNTEEGMDDLRDLIAAITKVHSQSHHVLTADDRSRAEEAKAILSRDSLNTGPILPSEQPGREVSLSDFDYPVWGGFNGNRDQETDWASRYSNWESSRGLRPRAGVPLGICEGKSEHG